MERKLGRNKPCPCGSGKKYKSCCYDLNFDYLIDEKGNISRAIPFSREIKEELEKYINFQERRFKKIFGREMEPEDPLLFESVYNEEFGEFNIVLIESMKKVGVASELIYAFKKTGLLLSEGNKDKMPKNNQKEWFDAIDEYLELRAKGIDPLKEQKIPKEIRY